MDLMNILITSQHLRQIGGGEVIEALTVSVTGECTPTEVADGYVIVTMALPAETYKNAEGVNF